MRWLGLFLLALASFCRAEDSVFYAGFESQWGCHPVRNNLAVSFAPPAGGTDLRLRMAIQDLPARKGEALIGALIGQGGTPPYAYTLSQGTLPTGISLNPSTGDLSGTPTVVGRSQFIAEVQDSALGVYQCRFAIEIIPALEVTAGDPPDGEFIESYDYKFGISGATGAVTWAVTSGALPGGTFALNSATGELTGAAVGLSATAYSFVVTATDGGSGDSIDINCSFILYPQFASSPISTTYRAYVNTEFKYTSYFDPSSGANLAGKPPYIHRFSNFSSTVSGDDPTSQPIWLVVDTFFGNFSGIAPGAGAVGFTITHVDSLGFEQTQSVSITIKNAVAASSATNNNVALFDGNTGLLIKDSGIPASNIQQLLAGDGVTIDIDSAGVVSLIGTTPTEVQLQLLARINAIASRLEMTRNEVNPLGIYLAAQVFGP